MRTIEQKVTYSTWEQVAIDRAKERFAALDRKYKNMEFFPIKRDEYGYRLRNQCGSFPNGYYVAPGNRNVWCGREETYYVSSEMIQRREEKSQRCRKLEEKERLAPNQRDY